MELIGAKFVAVDRRNDRLKEAVDEVFADLVQYHISGRGDKDVEQVFEMLKNK